VDDLTFRLEQAGRASTFIRRRAHRVELCEQQLSAVIQQRLKKWHQVFARVAHTLDALSPLAVLERGYAICLTREGKVIRSADVVGVDETINVKLHEGNLLAKVTSKAVKLPS
jgi:exodeoxyribonuclease VII large subunit